jgi:hypothetical protein
LEELNQCTDNINKLEKQLEVSLYFYWFQSIIWNLI